MAMCCHADKYFVRLVSLASDRQHRVKRRKPLTRVRQERYGPSSMPDNSRFPLPAFRNLGRGVF
jgi:hypothetical protein